MTSPRSLTLLSLLPLLVLVFSPTFTLSLTASPRFARLARRVDAAGGCNANVCFVLDSHMSLSEELFVAQKNFVLDVVSVIAVDSDVELAATQYPGGRNVRIAPLSPNVDAFVLAVNGTKQPDEEPFGGIDRGVAFCSRQLQRRRGEPLKMVVLGEGSEGRRRGFRRAVRMTDTLRNQGGEVCVVEGGGRGGLQRLAGGGERVYEVGSFLDVLQLERVVEELVEGICGVRI